jgi:fatty-acyl-CoA synthase
VLSTERRASEVGLEGLMQHDFPLTVAHIRRRAAEIYGERGVTTLRDGATHRTTYGDVTARVDRLGHVLAALGVEPGTRVATFAWNTSHHLELYLAVPSFGAVLHTLNIRLPADQLTFIADHARDHVVFVDDVVADRLAPIARDLPRVRHWIVMGDGDAGELEAVVPVDRYERLLEEAPETPFDWPEPDERAAAALCYTSGTTGDPKGVLYSHRSISLHAASNLFVDGVGLSSAEKLLVVVPMFHVNAWGSPFAAPLTGAELVFPGPHLDAASLAGLIERERCTMMNAVPTIFGDLLRYADDQQPDLSSLTNGICGGAAVSESLARGLEERHGVRIFQAWGMTETSPICTVARPPAEAQGAAHWERRLTQGRVMPWVELRTVGDDGTPCPRDGATPGEIEVRGPWIASGYYGHASTERFHDGWLRTGDIGTIDREGFMRITDRTKDVIKSGGEWISSVALENALAGHPDVVEAAVVATPHERWTERPLACVVVDAGADPSPDELRAFLATSVPRWWLPDEFAYLDEVPKTSTGKYDKKAIRAALAEGRITDRRAAS